MNPDLLKKAIEQAVANENQYKEIPTRVSGRVVHIDGDYLCYYAAGDNETPYGNARLNALGVIDRIVTWSGSDRAIVHLTAQNSTKGDRYLISTVKPYQAAREGSAKPKNWLHLRNWLTGYVGPAFTVKSWVNREADDGMAYLAQWHLANGQSDLCVIATADKDMRMLPGWHFVWDEGTMVWCPEDLWSLEVKHNQDSHVYGRKWFWLQMLQGDSVDNIPGLEKYIGPKGTGKPVGGKTALALLSDQNNPVGACMTVYELYSGYYGASAPSRFVEQAALLWLRRDKGASPTDFMNYLPNACKDVVGGAASALLERIEQEKHENNLYRAV